MWDVISPLDARSGPVIYAGELRKTLRVLNAQPASVHLPACADIFEAPGSAGATRIQLRAGNVRAVSGRTIPLRLHERFAATRSFAAIAWRLGR